MVHDLVVVGGGAAGFFAAIQLAEQHPSAKIVILEKTKNLLSKVKISGGGRCNVTHACFDPHEMIQYYPRGHKELLGPFHQFLCGDMIAWLEDHGVETKIEKDGRVFPTTNRSQSIIDCFLHSCLRLNINIYKNEGVTEIKPNEKHWQVLTKTNSFLAKNIFFATGSGRASWKLIAGLGHNIIPPVPSLFTFNIKNALLADLPGISMPNVEVEIVGSKFSSTGPILITHWGLSGPSILKLSAWAARHLHQSHYDFEILVNWIGMTKNECLGKMAIVRKKFGNKSPGNLKIFDMPNRLWFRMIQLLKLSKVNYADMNKNQIAALIQMLCASKFKVNGKSTFKDEFVSCGGIDTKEINFKTMESRILDNFYFGGEVINIDAITGGFNFQAAWTTAYIAAKSIATKMIA